MGSPQDERIGSPARQAVTQPAVPPGLAVGPGAHGACDATVARPPEVQSPRPAFGPTPADPTLSSTASTLATGSPVTRKRSRSRAVSIEGYEIVRQLGEGAMGTAFLARASETGEECVIKTIRLGRQSKAAIFFIREAQMGFTLRHPNIVRVLDFGESGGLLYLAMEYLEGGSLRDRIDHVGKLENLEALAHLSRLADALDHASRKKFIHRDVKPANILLTRDGVPKLADFGLAKMLSETEHARITRTGDMRGTPMYMPPENLTRAGHADSRSDIYSLGATYYHALAGQTPFPVRSLSHVLAMIVNDEPQPIEEVNPQVHPELAKVIRRMMAKRVEDRYPDPAALCQDLGRLASLEIG